MQTKGTVTRIEGDKAIIIVDRPTMCGESCANCTGGCKIENNTIEADNSLGAKVGECVIIETETKSVLFSAFLVYILPIVFLCAGYFSGEKIGFNESKSMICGFVLFILAFIILHFYDKKRKEPLNTKITEIVTQ